MKRCSWCRNDPVMERYHDEEWGVPVTGDHEIFERMILEMFQAGLSWRTILYKREAFRDAFFGFEIDRVAAMNQPQIEHLLTRQDIVRHRKKIEATIYNAKICQALRTEYGSLWQYLLTIREKTLAEVQAEFKNRFRFMGPVVTESFLQSMGMIDLQHEPDCWKHEREVG
jgi:DNA-3-methyladenine glycosylase I